MKRVIRHLGLKMPSVSKWKGIYLKWKLHQLTRFTTSQSDQMKSDFGGFMWCNSLAWCSFQRTGLWPSTYLQLCAFNRLIGVSQNSHTSTSSPARLPRLQTNRQTESWIDRHELCQCGYHSGWRLPPICSWRWGAAFTCLSARGEGIQGVAPG